ncbi:hypothetical protein F2Q69_00029797 [Brassica cretica]|uniref:Uncharacterized protein n=1 Tax=Brassica cretica TaxID=69181 RepID=A0A8S9RW12_BRACR|nr:hypothetical protein F2Q69_00029797 [Brassica cretica]
MSGLATQLLWGGLRNVLARDADCVGAWVLWAQIQDGRMDGLSVFADEGLIESLNLMDDGNNVIDSLNLCTELV